MAYENGLSLINVSVGEIADIVLQQDLKAVQQDPLRFEAHTLRVQVGQDPEQEALALVERALGQPYTKASVEERAVIERRVGDDLVRRGLTGAQIKYGARLTLEQVIALILSGDSDEAA